MKLGGLALKLLIILFKAAAMVQLCDLVAGSAVPIFANATPRAPAPAIPLLWPETFWP